MINYIFWRILMNVFEVALDIVLNVALLFIMMVPGFLMKKCRLSTESFGKGVSNLVLYIAQPALTFVAFLKPFDKQILINSAYVLVFSVLLHLVFALITMNMFKKAPDGMRRMLRFATIFSNVAFMGIPLVDVVLGEKYPGATIYALIYSITYNIFLWSLGVKICTDGKDNDKNGVDDHDDHKKKSTILTAFIHPTTIAAFLGLLFFIFPIENSVPDLAVEALEMLKGLVRPLSMLVIGLRLADMSFKGMLGDKHMYVFLALRHVALPLLALGLVKLVDIILPGGVDEVVQMVIVILAAVPAATSSTMFAEKFDCDSVYVSRLVTVSTLLSIITIPLLLLLV